MFEELFIRKTVDIQKAVMFGFVQNNSNYIYETDILDGTFLLQIIITPDGNIDTKLTEKAIGDEYVLYKQMLRVPLWERSGTLLKLFSNRWQISVTIQKFSSLHRQKKLFAMFVRNTVMSLNFYGRSFPIMQSGGVRIIRSGTVLC